MTPFLFLSKHHMEAAVTFGAETPPWATSPKQAHPQMIHGCIWGSYPQMLVSGIVVSSVV
jgi:hypothetical protein